MNTKIIQLCIKWILEIQNPSCVGVMYANSDDRFYRERIWRESQPSGKQMTILDDTSKNIYTYEHMLSVIDKQKGRNVFNPYPPIPPIDRRNRKNQICCSYCSNRTGFIIFGEIQSFLLCMYTMIMFSYF